MKLFGSFIVILFIVCCSCNSGNQRSSRNAANSANSTVSVPPYLSADSIMNMLSGEPLHLQFNMINGGEMSSYEAKDSNRTATISFETKTRKIKSVSYFINGSPLYPKLKDAMPLIQFFNLFDRSAGTYFSNNFGKILDNRKAFQSSKSFIDSNRMLKYTLDHSLFDVRDSIKKQSGYAITSDMVYMVAEMRSMD